MEATGRVVIFHLPSWLPLFSEPVLFVPSYLEPRAPSSDNDSGMGVGNGLGVQVGSLDSLHRGRWRFRLIESFPIWEGTDAACCPLRDIKEPALMLFPSLQFGGVKVYDSFGTGPSNRDLSTV